MYVSVPPCFGVSASAAGTIKARAVQSPATPIRKLNAIVSSRSLFMLCELASSRSASQSAFGGSVAARVCMLRGDLLAPLYPGRLDWEFDDRPGLGQRCAYRCQPLQGP